MKTILCCLCAFAFGLLHIGECLAKEQYESTGSSDTVKSIIHSENLPTLSDFESRYKKIKTPTNQMQLQYCDLIVHAFSIDKIYKRNDLIGICEGIAKHVDTVNLTEKEKCRAFVLGVLLSTSREKEIFFVEKLASIDPDNAFVTSVRLKDSILYGDVKQTEKLIKHFMTQEKFDLYTQQGYQNQYDIWTPFFGENLISYYSLHREQYGGVVNHRIWEYASLFWMYDIKNKYQRTLDLKSIPLIDYFSLDQLFLHKVKMSWEDFGWYADVTNSQLDFFYRLYHDSTLYYASGINVPEQNRSFPAIDKDPLGTAKQYWLNKRDQLQDILFEQRKEIFELIKIRVFFFQNITSLSPNANNKYVEYLKLHVQGKEMSALNNLNDYDPNQPANLVKTRLMPLIEKEKQFWKIKLTEKPKEKNEEEEISIEDIYFE